MAGRKSIEGSPRKYILTDDVHSYISAKGGSQWLNETVRTIIAVNHEH